MLKRLNDKTVTGALYNNQ